MAAERFKRVAQADIDYRQQLTDAGVTVVTFSDEEMKVFSDAIRQDVWPNIKDEIGEELFTKLSNYYSK